MRHEITHQPDPDDGHLIQIVTPERLREVLDADGETYDRPADFGPEDQWEVEP